MKRETAEWINGIYLSRVKELISDIIDEILGHGDFLQNIPVEDRKEAKMFLKWLKLRLRMVLEESEFELERLVEE